MHRIARLHGRSIACARVRTAIAVIAILATLITRPSRPAGRTEALARDPVAFIVVRVTVTCERALETV